MASFYSLRNAGFAEYGAKAAARRFLVVAGDLVTPETSTADAERILSATQDAWLYAELEPVPPPGLKLPGRRGGRIVSADPRAPSEGPFLVADGDDRQMVAATARADPATIAIGPPTPRAREISAFLARHFPYVVRCASAIEAQYECEGQLIAAAPTDPTIEEALGDNVCQVVALTLRYRSSFYRGNIEEALARLASIRLRKLASHRR